MADPTKYTPDFDFTNYQANKPSKPLPAVELDLELGNIALTASQTIDALKQIRRSDGAVKNKTIGYDQLKDELNGFGFNPPSEWETETSYIERDTVFANAGFYRAAASHISGDFEDDLAAGKWVLVADFTAATSEAQAFANAADASATAAAGSANTASDAADAAVAAADVVGDMAPAINTAVENIEAIQDAPDAAFAAAQSAAAAAASAASVDVDAVLKSYLGIVPAISRWKAEQSSSRVLWAGTGLTVGTTNVGGGLLAAGRTHVSGEVGEAVRQDGLIRTAKLGVDTLGSSPANNLKIKVLRPNGASYDLVAESEYLTATATGMNTFNLSTPLPVQPGDQIGVWMKGGAAGTCTQLSAAATTAVYRYIEGDAGSGSTWIDVAGTSILSDYQGIKPFAVCFGESIFEGHNGATNWHSFSHLGPAGNPAAEPFNQVRALIPSLDYQNYAIGGSLWSSVAARAAVATTWAQPKVAVVAAGVNDVAAGTPWGTVLGNMNAFKAALPAGTKIFVCEMMPYHIGTDVQAATIRAWNENYAAWCAENGATLIKCWDAMGQIRPSTGFKDDLIGAYHYGGGHLTVPAGVDAYAKLISDGLQSVLWI